MGIMPDISILNIKKKYNLIKLVTNFEEVKKEWAKTKPADF